MIKILSIFFVTIFITNAFANEIIFPQISNEEMLSIIPHIKEARVRAEASEGLTYCSDDGLTSMRVFIDKPTRLMFNWPGVDGFERGMETPGLIMSAQQIPIPSEVETTLRRAGIKGVIANTVAAYKINVYETANPIESVAVQAFYLDDSGMIVRNEGILILSDAIHGVYFIGSTKSCK